MAIDSAQDRYSVLNARRNIRQAIPSGAISKAARFSILGLYDLSTTATIPRTTATIFRTTALKAESRFRSVPAGHRLFLLAGENRTSPVPSEVRTMSTISETRTKHE